MSEFQEQAVVNAKASVLIYDDTRKRWLPVGETRLQVEAKVQLYHNARACSYRIVARTCVDDEVILNCPLYPGMKYNLTTMTFHQWRSELRRLYGLNFTSTDQAHNFGQAVLAAVRMLRDVEDHSSVTFSPDVCKSSRMHVRNAFASSKSLSMNTCDHHTDVAPCSSSKLEHRQINQSRRQPNMHQIGRTTSMAGDFAIHRSHHQRRDEEDQQYTHTPRIQKHQSQRIAQDHKRRSSAGSTCSTASVGPVGCHLSRATQMVPSVPTSPAGTCTTQPLVLAPATCSAQQTKSQMPTMVCSAPLAPPGPPPLPPPPPLSMPEPIGRNQISLSHAITTAKLRKTNPNIGKVDEPNGSTKDTRSKSVGNVEFGSSRSANSKATLATTSTGHSEVITEMAATLARRRLIVDSAAQVVGSEVNSKSDPKSRIWETRNGSKPSLNEISTPTANDTPKTHRKMPSGSSLSSQEDSILSLASNGNSTKRCATNNGAMTASISITSDSLDQWKQEILCQVRRELSKAKTDIIDALRSELNRR